MSQQSDVLPALHSSTEVELNDFGVFVFNEKAFPVSLVSSLQGTKLKSPGIEKKEAKVLKQFQHIDKEACWLKADAVRGRDPSRWRRDLAGNVICKKLRGCRGPFCMDFDHVVPLSKGGESVLDNCQVLQTTANRHKGDRLVEPTTDIKKYYKEISDRRVLPLQRHLDIVEFYVYGGSFSRLFLESNLTLR
ncbi:endonuclease isoform 2 [Galdieria sulphuraria]|uniref:Endonuclease isoform 2 n=1 Tax=Galdieria sulphuraria TaxID=130081 RepID=M2VZT3_GALSU|nr:endonuclease isoform 2 [Galdieria sulphuraria]EME28846.1 endonuclease isoform 2 [Galdieria sulphuraria]|eukprot:XP_005705366.1 endonuclease isoform 2 [Galdieria sulphuraria]